MSRSVLALFAKRPAPGFVKSRLCPPLTPEEAAELYTAMLEDILEQTGKADGWERALWFTPDDAQTWFEARAPGFALHPQQGRDLGARLWTCFRTHAADGCVRIVVRGTDSPSLPEDAIVSAFAALERADVVVGPDEDGGYNLIGLREPDARHAALFDLAMSTARVAETTLERARDVGLACVVLPVHHDVDTVEDLRRLELSARTPRTARWLAGARASIAR